MYIIPSVLLHTGTTIDSRALCVCVWCQGFGRPHPLTLFRAISNGRPNGKALLLHDTLETTGALRAAQCACRIAFTTCTIRLVRYTKQNLVASCLRWHFRHIFRYASVSQAFFFCATSKPSGTRLYCTRLSARESQTVAFIRPANNILRWYVRRVRWYHISWSVGMVEEEALSFVPWGVSATPQPPIIHILYAHNSVNPSRSPGRS